MLQFFLKLQEFVLYSQIGWLLFLVLALCRQEVIRWDGFVTYTPLAYAPLLPPFGFLLVCT